MRESGASVVVMQQCEAHDQRNSSEHLMKESGASLWSEAIQVSKSTNESELLSFLTRGKATQVSKSTTESELHSSLTRDGAIQVSKSTTESVLHVSFTRDGTSKVIDLVTCVQIALLVDDEQDRPERPLVTMPPAKALICDVQSVLSCG